MPKITNIKAFTVLDSRGFPTVQCDITITENNLTFTESASVPSGASTGTHEALELRDQAAAFNGKGVLKAIENVNLIIAPELLNKNFDDAKNVDELVLSLDDTENKSKLGANAILGVSMAVHRAFAKAKNLELYAYLSNLYFEENFEKLQEYSQTKNNNLGVVFPRWMCNVINGGVHADSGLSIQEFMLVPKADSFEEEVQIASEIYHKLKSILKSKKMVTAVGDEGGFAPHISSTEEVFDTLQTAIEQAGYKGKCDLAIDAAASEFYGKSIKPTSDISKLVSAGLSMVSGTPIGEGYAADKYYFQDKILDSAQMVDEINHLVDKYGIISLEDILSEDDLAGWKMATEKMGQKAMLVGDDLFVTNVERLRKIGIEQGIANSILIKLNQIGSVSETCAAISLAQKNNMVTVISHRSGETVDSFIADLTLASQSKFIKTGAVSRGERLSKINRLLQIRS